MIILNTVFWELIVDYDFEETTTFKAGQIWDNYSLKKVIPME